VRVQVLWREMIDDRFYNGNVYFEPMRRRMHICKIVQVLEMELFPLRHVVCRIYVIHHSSATSRTAASPLLYSAP
jgi:hypothetical protein